MRDRLMSGAWGLRRGLGGGDKSRDLHPRVLPCTSSPPLPTSDQPTSPLLAWMPWSRVVECGPRQGPRSLSHVTPRRAGG